MQGHGITVMVAGSKILLPRHVAYMLHIFHLRVNTCLAGGILSLKMGKFAA